MLLGISEDMPQSTQTGVDEGNIHAEIVLTDRANTDKRLRHVWARIPGASGRRLHAYPQGLFLIGPIRE
jgi:hypothetical protein